MNTTFLTWLAVAAVVGGALLLFLGMPASNQETPLALEAVSTESAAVVEGAYWEPVTPVTTRPIAFPPVMHTVATRPQVVQPCTSCGMAQPAPVVPAYVQQPLTQRCGACGATRLAAVQQANLPQQPCSTCGAVLPAPVAPIHSCSSCGAAATTSAVPIYMQYPQMASCEQRVPSPCGSTPCSSVPMTCASTCGTTCPLNKPGINRNMDLCVEECTFVQLHSTIPHPICSDVRFEWTTSKGSFLEANVPDPIYYVPTTQFSDGEDVWVVLKITDSSGAQYTDQLKLHVINQR
jgi:hypothetical protein